MKNSESKKYQRGLTEKEIQKRVYQWECFVKTFGQHISPGRLRQVIRGMVDDHEKKQLQIKRFQFLDRINKGGCAFLFYHYKKY